ncbi:hypothetical protein [Sorangium sp. So ce854]|uniref:hypothetical protein n=1 Tax=Sorangium sp. So ce854 TaxID=3133322 RepID=UPI003F63988E
MPAGSSALALRAARTAASAVACALLALPAAADEPRAARRPVLVLAASPSADRIGARAIDLVAAHIRPLGIRLQIVRPGAPRPALQKLLPDARALADAWDARGVLWVDAGSRGELALYVVERDGDQVYGRRIPVAPGQTATALESLANIAGAVAEELREGRVAALTEVNVAAAEPDPAAPRAPGAPTALAASTATGAPTAPGAPATPPPPGAPLAARAAAPAPPRPRPPAARPGADAGPDRLPTIAVLAGYTGANFSGEAPWQSAAAFRASWAPVDGAVVGLGYELMPATAIGDERIEVDLVRHPVTTSGHVRFRLPLGLDLQLGARASVDVVQRIPQGGAPQPVRQPQATPQPPPPQPPTDDALPPPPPRGHALPPPPPWPPPRWPPPWPPPPKPPPHGAPPPPTTTWPRMAPQELPPLETRTDVLVSVAPVAELGYPLTERIRLKAMLGVDFLLTKPDAAVHPDLALQPHPVRILAGLGLELGLGLPTPPAAAGGARR